MADIRSFTLTGTKHSEAGLLGYNCCIKNNGSRVLVVSDKPGAALGEPGVLPIQPGESAVYIGISPTMYFDGEGDVALISSEYPDNFFVAAL